MSVMHGRKCDGISQRSYLLFEVNELNFIFFRILRVNSLNVRTYYLPITYSMPKLLHVLLSCQSTLLLYRQLKEKLKKYKNGMFSGHHSCSKVDVQCLKSKLSF